MKPIDVFKFAIELGREADARKPGQIEAELRRQRVRYEPLQGGRGDGGVHAFA